MKVSEELKARLEELKNESKVIVENSEAGVEEITAKTEEIQTLKAKIELQEKSEQEDEIAVENKIKNLGKGVEKMNIKDLINKIVAKEVLTKEEDEMVNVAYTKAFVNAFRKKTTNEDLEVLNGLSENSDANGGLIVPKDVETKINEFKRSLPQLENLINKIPVSTNSGSRVYESVATMTALANVTDDTADIANMGNPTFESITYAIKDYAGILPVPNDLLQDSDQAILTYLAGWIARKSTVTRNSLILTILLALTPTTLADWKAIKKVINITLNPIFATNAKIITNQDGYQYLDTLVDGQNRPLLQPNVSIAGGNVLFGKEVVVVPNTILLTTGTTIKLAPIFIGNLAEAITMFERQGYQIATTNVGGTAFIKNRTEVRAIEREDVKAIDATAVVYGKIDVTAVLA